MRFIILNRDIMFTIYKHTNKVNGKVYVGQTKFTMEKRLKQYVYSSKRGNKYNCVRPFNAALAKYGIERFTSEVIESGLNKEEASEREIFWIQELGSFVNGYNATKGGDYFLGYKQPKGKDHHSYKREVFKFFHKEHPTFIGTQGDLAEAYGIKRGTVSKLVGKNMLKRVKGWAMCIEDLTVPTHYRLQPDGTTYAKNKCLSCGKTIDYRSIMCIKCVPKKAAHLRKKPAGIKHCKVCPKCKIVGIENRTKVCRSCLPRDLPNSRRLCPVCEVNKITNKNKACRSCTDTSGKNNGMYGKTRHQYVKDAVSARMRGTSDKTRRTWVHKSGVIEKDITCLALRDKYPELLISKLNAVAKKLLNTKGYLIGKTHKGWKVHE